jgi:hypothetical protein
VAVETLWLILMVLLMVLVVVVFEHIGDPFLASLLAHSYHYLEVQFADHSN